MNEETDFLEAFSTINEISNNPKPYIAGILLKDAETLRFIEIIDCLQAVVMQSVQVGNRKRAAKFIIAANVLMNRHKAHEDRLKAEMTELLIST